MRKLAALVAVLFTMSLLCHGHTIDEVFGLLEDLKSYRSIVTVKGTKIGSDEGTMEISFEGTAIIKPVEVFRMRFTKPEELEGQEICITKERAWVYQPMLEQVVVAPVEKFSFPGMPEEGFKAEGPTTVEGGFEELKKFIKEKTTVTYLGEEDGIWKFKVVPKEKIDSSVDHLIVEFDAKARFLKSIKVYDKGGKILLEVSIELLERNKPYDPQKLSAYPEGAEVIEIEEE